MFNLVSSSYFKCCYPVFSVFLNDASVLKNPPKDVRLKQNRAANASISEVGQKRAKGIQPVQQIFQINDGNSKRDFQISASAFMIY